MSFIENKTMVVNGMDNASNGISIDVLSMIKVLYSLSSLTIPSVRLHPFNSFRCIDSSPESKSIVRTNDFESRSTNKLYRIS